MEQGEAEEGGLVLPLLPALLPSPGTSLCLSVQWTPPTWQSGFGDTGIRLKSGTEPVPGLHLELFSATVTAAPLPSHSSLLAPGISYLRDLESPAPCGPSLLAFEDILPGFRFPGFWVEAPGWVSSGGLILPGPSVVLPPSPAL